MKWCETPRSLQLLHVLDVFHVKGVEKAGRIGKSDLHRGGHTSLHGPGGEVAGGLVGSFQPSHVDLGGLSRKGLWSGSGSLVLGHHALRICLELNLTAPSINTPSIFPIFPTQIPLRKNLTCRGERLWQAKTYQNIFNSLGRTLTPKYTHPILDLHCDIEVCGYLPFGTNLVEPLGMLSWHCPYLAPPQSGLVRCSSIGWIQRFNLLILAWSYWIGSEGTEVGLTSEDLQFAMWILLDVFFVSHPSEQLQLSRLLTSLEAASVFCCVAWEVEVPISLQGGGKKISQVKESAVGWGVSVKTLFIPWPDSILPIWPTWYVSFWILRARLVWAQNKKGLFNYPKRNLDLSGWWFFPPNQRDSADGLFLLNPERLFFLSLSLPDISFVAKTGWDWQRPHQGSFDATSAFDALLLLMAKTFDAFS